MQGDAVLAKVYASNSIGESPVSDENTITALIQALPHKPSTPPTRNSATTDSQLVVDWTSLTDPLNGGSSIISYHLQYDDASNGAIWTDLVGLSVDSLV